MTASALTSRVAQGLERLGRDGASSFDPPSVRFIERLVGHAHALGGGAAERLLRRAIERIELLDAAYRSARAAAQASLDRLRGAAPELDPMLRRLVESGDWRAIPRVEAQWRLREARAHRARGRSWLRAGSRAVAAHALSRVDEPAEGELSAAHRGGADRLALFREAAELARAELAVARALDQVPTDAGPYNAQALAARALGALGELSPAYLRAYLANLDDLARLEAATAAIAEAPGKKPRRRQKPRT